MKLLSFFSLLLINSALHAQVDTVGLQRIYYRAMHLAENKADSIRYYADYVGQAGKNGGWAPATVMSQRLSGFYYENRGISARR
ncbi:hypothetical protein ACQ86N_40505 [Puia sp. P3]|uniref:hypothetical protein n=1 Tax=Puia sp. P3 TaxID=3423952 RepID=UPI003D669A9E